MSFPITPTQSGIQAAMVAFIAATLPGVLVVSGQDNRVPEPTSGDFVVMTPIFFDRIETAIDKTADCRFTGQISGQVLAVDAVQIGTILVGSTLVGTLVTPCTVMSQSSGTVGGVGNYLVSVSQTTPVGTVFSAGNTTRQQNMEWRVQLDFHSGSNPSNLDAGDMAAIFVTQFRSVFATDFFEGQGIGAIDALYADEARQVPFVNAEQQYEWRWIVEATIQANQVVVVPQLFADLVSVQLREVSGAGVITGGLVGAEQLGGLAPMLGFGTTVLAWPDGTLVALPVPPPS